MNAYDVLCEHHNVLRGLCKKITELPPTSDERQSFLDEFLVELDIHMRIEDDLFYPAMQAASTLVAIAHAEHRQVFDQLAVVLRTPTNAAAYDDEWRAFVTVLDAHADEEERDLCPAPVEMMPSSWMRSVTRCGSASTNCANRPSRRFTSRGGPR